MKILKKVICAALLVAALALSSCKRIDLSDVTCGYHILTTEYELVNDTDWGCEISWCYPSRQETDPDVIQLAPGASFSQTLGVGSRLKDPTLLFRAEEIHFSFTDDARCDVVDSEWYWFWERNDQPHQESRWLERGTYGLKYYLSDIRALSY